MRESEQAKRRRTVEVLLAEKAAEQKRIAAEAEKIRAAVEAEAQRLLNEAENVLTDAARYSLFRRKLLDRVEGIVAASVKPLEKIEGIKIVQLDGLNGGSGEGRKNATDEVINSALRYRVQAPMIDGLLADLGIEGGCLLADGRADPRGPRPAVDRQGRRADGRRQRAGRSEEPRPRRARPARRLLERWLRGQRPSGRRQLRSGDGEHLRLFGARRAGRPGLGADPRLQRACRAGIPRIADSQIEDGLPADQIGCVRNFRLQNGDRIRERLLGLSDHDLFCTYAILEIADAAYELRRDAAPDAGLGGNRTFIEWTAEFDCAPEVEDDLVHGIAQNVFQGGFDSLKRHFGS